MSEENPYRELLKEIQEDRTLDQLLQPDTDTVTKALKIAAQLHDELPQDGELLPCPFCGSEAKYIDQGADGAVHCWSSKCGATGEVVDYMLAKEELGVSIKEAAIKAWNTRPLFNKLLEEVKG